MRTAKLIVLPVALLVGLTACNGSNPDPQDDKPKVAELVTGKRIDPPVYEVVNGKCLVKNKQGKCTSWKTVKKETDDQDWVLITTGGEYDVEEDEYNRVNVGETWPK